MLCFHFLLDSVLLCSTLLLIKKENNKVDKDDNWEENLPEDRSDLNEEGETELVRRKVMDQGAEESDSVTPNPRGGGGGGGSFFFFFLPL